MKHCEHCQNEFQPKRPAVRFCSRTCTGKWLSAQRPLTALDDIAKIRPKTVLPTSEWAFSKEDILRARGYST